MSGTASVLVVDDDQDVRESFVAILEHHGYAVEAFASADAFLASPGAAASTGCLLLDIRMPGMDGMELLQYLHDCASRLKVVMVTGHGDQALALRALRGGACEFLEKPFLKEVLLAAVARALSSDGIQEAATTKEYEQRFSGLSDGQQSIVRAMLDGLDVREIAERLNEKPRTIELERARILSATQAQSIPHLLRMALSLERVGTSPT